MNIDFSSAIDQLQQMVNDLVSRIPNIIVGFIIFLVFFFAARLIKFSVTRINVRTRRSYNLGLVLGRLAQWFTVLLGLLVAAVIIFPNFSPAEVIQLLGIGSVAIGFAFRDILQNFLAGILLLLNEPFRIDDQIVVGDYEGTVENIETRATTIRTYDGSRVVIPNATIFTESVLVKTAYEKRRLEADIGIGYGDSITQARQLILESLARIDEVEKEPAPQVIVFELADFAVILRVWWWIQPPRRTDAIAARDGVLEAIKETLLLNGVDLPFPTQQVLFHNQTEPDDGDRSRQREGWPAGNKIDRSE